MRTAEEERRNLPASLRYLQDRLCWDLVLGGGWGVGRVVNVVGDRSSGKTLLAIEACANYSIVGNAEDHRYAEAESAFDHAYAQTIGMPEGIQFPDEQLRTVEDFYHDINGYLETQKKKKAELGLYVLDSLDALSDEAEMERGHRKRELRKFQGQEDVRNLPAHHVGYI